MTTGGSSGGTPRVGVDAGATLSKIVIDDGRGGLRHELRSSRDREGVAEFLGGLACSHVGITGGGARWLADRLDCSVSLVDEFEAWSLGAQTQQGPSTEPYLLVSLGSGTSILRVESSGHTSRVGGTALGGGSVTGLGAALVGTRNFEELCDMAERGDKSRADLIVSDIYRDGDINLPGDLTAASFGKLSREAAGEVPASSPADRAAALMSMIGENVGLICAGLAAIHGAKRVVFGGSTLTGNTILTNVLTVVVMFNGSQAVFLEDGAYTGAIGALSATSG